MGGYTAEKGLSVKTISTIGTTHRQIYTYIRFHTTPQTHSRFHIGKFLRKAVKAIRKSFKEIWLSQGIYVYLCHNNDNKGYASYRKNKSLW